MKNEIVFITGANGFIGANLTRKLLDGKYKTHCLIRTKSDTANLKRIENRIHIHRSDNSDTVSLRKLLRKIKPDYIINLAGYGNSSIHHDDQKIIEVNINLTLNLLSASRQLPYKAFIQTGSSSEYGKSDKPMQESDLLKPETVYAASKAGATLLCQAYAKTYGKPVFIIRPFSIYGPFEKKIRFIPTIIGNLLNNHEILITGSEVRHDFLYVEDITRLYLKIMETEKIPSGSVFNAGSGSQYTNEEVVKTLFKVTGRTVRIRLGGYAKRIWDTDFWQADITKTKKMLSWIPEYNLLQGLKKTYDFLARQKTR